MNFQTASTEQLQAQGYKVKTLKTRGPRKGETLGLRGSQSHGTSGGVQTVRSGDGDHTSTRKGRAQGSGDRCVGGGLTMNKVGGMGKQMVSDLAKVQRKFRAQAKADRRAFILGGSAA